MIILTCDFDDVLSARKKTDFDDVVISRKKQPLESMQAIQNRRKYF